MPAFLVADIDVKDSEIYNKYRLVNPEIVKKFGGRYIALGGEIDVLEGDWHPRRMVIIAFPDMTALRGFYDCPEYRELRKIRWASADSRIVAIEGLPEPTNL